LIDYAGVKLFPLLVVLWLIRGQRIRVADVGLTRQAPLPFLVTFLACAFVRTVIDPKCGSQVNREIPGYPALWRMPAIATARNVTRTAGAPASSNQHPQPVFSGRGSATAQPGGKQFHAA